MERLVTGVWHAIDTVQRCYEAKRRPTKSNVAWAAFALVGMVGWGAISVLRMRRADQERLAEIDRKIANGWNKN